MYSSFIRSTKIAFFLLISKIRRCRLRGQPASEQKGPAAVDQQSLQDTFCSSKIESLPWQSKFPEKKNLIQQKRCQPAH